MCGVSQNRVPPKNMSKNTSSLDSSFGIAAPRRVFLGFLPPILSNTSPGRHFLTFFHEKNPIFIDFYHFLGVRQNAPYWAKNTLFWGQKHEKSSKNDKK